MKGITNAVGAGMRRSNHPENAVSGRDHSHPPRTAGLLKVGETPDGEGGDTIYGKHLPTRTSLERNGLPFRLAQGVTLQRAVPCGETLT